MQMHKLNKIHNLPFLSLSKNIAFHRSGRMYSAHFDNFQLTESLSPYPYLQQIVTQTVS